MTPTFSALTPNPEQAAPGTPILTPAGRRGPRTPEGKSRCRLNALRHGLTGQVLVLTPEEQAAYDAHCAALQSHYDPHGPIEQQLVHSIADSQWRLQRASAMESAIFARGLVQPTSSPATGHPQVDDAFAQAHTWLAESKNLALLTLYEQRIHRKLMKDTQALQAEQHRRIAAYEQAMEIAKRLYKSAKAAGKPYAPEAYFGPRPQTPESVFSSAAVSHEIARDALVAPLSIPPIAPRKQAA